jgi:hypothetical protein
VRHLGKGLSGIIVANLSWILGLIVFAIFLVAGSWQFGLLAGLVTFLVLLVVGLKMLYNGAKKAIQNPDEVFNDLDKAAGRFFGDV